MRALLVSPPASKRLVRCDPGSTYNRASSTNSRIAPLTFHMFTHCTNTRA